MQAFDLIQWGSFLPELDEAGCLVDQLSIGALSNSGHLLKRFTPPGWNLVLLPFRRGGCHQDGAYDLLQVAVCQIRVGITRSDDLALLGQAESPVDAFSRLGPDGAVGWAAAACDGAAAPVEYG